jgi:hypothetical protein
MGKETVKTQEQPVRGSVIVRRNERNGSRLHCDVLASVTALDADVMPAVRRTNVGSDELCFVFWRYRVQICRSSCPTCVTGFFRTSRFLPLPSLSSAVHHVLSFGHSQQR